MTDASQNNESAGAPPSTPVPAAPVLGYATPAVNVRPRPLVPGVARFAGIVVGVVLPLVCFGFSIAGFPLGPEWQSGKFEDHVKLLLSARSAWPFFPLLAYSMACMFAVCIDPRNKSLRRLCRLGIYGGVPLAAQFCLIMAISLSEAGDRVILALGAGAVATVIPLGLLALLNFTFCRFGARRVWPVIACIVGAALLVGLAIDPRSIPAAIFGAGIFSMLLAPGWALATYLVMSILIRRVVRQERQRGLTVEPLSPLGPLAWLTGYAASWGLAVHQAIQAYRALPTAPPHHCYIASAAARGHRRFVRSRTSHQGVPVNDQLRRLKCGEIALTTLTPRLHRAMRRIYDAVGPATAAAMIHPLLADLAYALLKPAEWATSFALRRAVPQFDRLAAGLYSEENASVHERAPYTDHG